MFKLNQTNDRKAATNEGYQLVTLNLTIWDEADTKEHGRGNYVCKCYSTGIIFERRKVENNYLEVIKTTKTFWH